MLYEIKLHPYHSPPRRSLGVRGPLIDDRYRETVRTVRRLVAQIRNGLEEVKIYLDRRFVDLGSSG